MSESIKLTGAALALAQDIQDVFLKGHKAQADLQEEFARRLNEIQESTKAALIERWPSLLTAAGLTAANPMEWALDTRYLDAHGAAFLSHQTPEGFAPGDDFTDLIPAPSRRH